MALVKNPLYSSDARGSVGGITFSRSFAGNVAKIKARPPRRARRTQPLNRSILSFLARAWGGLTDVQRDSWEQWALNHPEQDKFGGTFIMSGICAYEKLNHHALRLGGVGSNNSLPPTDPPAAEIATFTVSTGITNPGDIDIALTVNGTGDSSDFIEIQIAGPFQSKGRQEVFNQFRYVNDVAGDQVADTIDSLDEGFWYWLRGRYVSAEGQITPWMYGQATPMLTV